MLLKGKAPQIEKLEQPAGLVPVNPLLSIPFEVQRRNEVELQFLCGMILMLLLWACGREAQGPIEDKLYKGIAFKAMSKNVLT